MECVAQVFPKRRVPPLLSDYSLLLHLRNAQSKLGIEEYFRTRKFYSLTFQCAWHIWVPQFDLKFNLVLYSCQRNHKTARWERDVEYAPLFKPVATTELLPSTGLIILKPSHHVTLQRSFVLLMYSVSEDAALSFGRVRRIAKSTFSLVMSVCPLETTRLSLDRSS